MLIAIFQHTPVWVWGLLAVLVGLGLSQAVPRDMTVRRITVLPLVLLALSLAGVAAAFAARPAGLALALAAWLAGIAGALALGRSLLTARGAHWQPQAARVHVPGSWLPLALIVGLFLLKYAVGVGLALHPELAAGSGFAASIGLAYGGFSGLFAARALSLWAVVRAESLRTESPRTGALRAA